MAARCASADKTLLAPEPLTPAVASVSLTRIAQSRLPTPFALFQITVYATEDGKEHAVIHLGRFDVEGAPPPLVRLHSECLTGDALFSLRCDCGPQLESALQRIAEAGCGAVLYLRQEGRGIGLGNKIRAYALQDQGADTVEANHQLGFPADARDFGVAVELLRRHGLCSIRLMTNNPRKLDQLRMAGIEVVERVPLHAGENPYNADYLATKASKLGHLIGPR